MSKVKDNMKHRLAERLSPKWKFYISSSVQFSCSVVPDSLQPHGLQNARLPCPSSNHGACSNRCPLSQ